MATNNSCDESTATTGKILQGQGIGTASNYSTATYPSVATGTGTILRADGTNWVASTATYPNTAGTSGNVLTSDGTNWVSSAATSSAFINGYLSTSQAVPADATTYYINNNSIFANNTSSTSAPALFYAPVAFTLTKVYGSLLVLGTLGSSENCTLFIRVNDTTNTNITTSLTATTANNTFNNTGLSISLNAGDFFSFGFTTPTWSTNPDNVALRLSFSS